MKRFLMLVTLVVALSSVAHAERLPPVPNVSDSTPVPAATMPQPPSEDNVSSRRFRAEAPGIMWRNRAEAPSCSAAAPSCTTAVPPAQAFAPSCSAPVTASRPQGPTCEATASRPQGPTCEATASRRRDPTCEAHSVACGCDGFRECSLHVREFQPLKFVVREFVQRPVYGIQKVTADAQTRRLGREECRLENKAAELACQSEKLANKAATACPCDPHAKAVLTRQSVRYANQANDLTLKLAELEAEQAANVAKQHALRAKHMELYPLRD